MLVYSHCYIYSGPYCRHNNVYSRARFLFTVDRSLECIIIWESIDVCNCICDTRLGYLVTTVRTRVIALGDYAVMGGWYQFTDWLE